jgi:hypothetical protein
MHRTLRSARPAAALALTLAVGLVVPGAAFAGTTEPTPVTTSTTTTTSTGTGTGTPSDPSTTSPESSTSSTTSTTSDGTPTTPSSSGPTTGLPSTLSATRSSASAPSATTVAKARAAAAAAAAAAAVPESGSAAAFIASTLAARDDHYVYPGSTFFDGGNSIDAILALDAVGTQAAQADASYDYLDANIGGYMGADFDSQYAGSTAKAVLAAVAHGADPTDVGGLDLVAGLQEAEGAVTPGRFSDLPVDCGFPPCDYSNTIGQSLALIALARAGEPLSTDSVSFLLAQQCADGGFRGALEGAGCTSDPDATAFATQALVASGLALLCGTGATTLPAQVGIALTRGLDHLEDVQAPSGALNSSDGAPNANTTGVAAQAFYAGGRTAAADAATAFLVTLQVAPTAPAASRGGIAFTTADRTILESTPVTPDEQTAFTNAVDRELRATPQATLALAGGSLVDVAAAGVVDAPAASACPAPPVTTTTTTSSTTTTTGATTTSSTAPGGGAGDPADPASATPGALALTGTNVAAMTLLGTLLLVTGAGAIVLARRKGVHA